MTRTTKTAAELMAELQRSPEFVRDSAEGAAAAQQLEAETAAHEAPLIAALSRVSVNVRSVWDLVNSTADYGPAVQVLTEHLRLPYPPKVREGIARSLAVPSAKPYVRELIEAFVQEPTTRLTSQTKWALACAVAAVADESLRDELLSLVSDPAHGEGRLMLLQALARFPDDRVVALIRTMAGDPEIGPGAKALLGLKKRKSV